MRLWSGARQVHRVVGEETTGEPLARSAEIAYIDTLGLRAHRPRRRELIGLAILALLSAAVAGLVVSQLGSRGRRATGVRTPGSTSRAPLKAQIVPRRTVLGSAPAKPPRQGTCAQEAAASPSHRESRMLQGPGSRSR